MLEWREAELKFADIMTQRGYDVQDVSKNDEYFDRDIDFIIGSFATGLVKTFEVKCDAKMNETGNLYLETWSKYGNGRGWWNCCQADYLVYCDAVKEKFYVFEMKALRERVAQMPLMETSCGTDSIGRLISIAKVRDLAMEL